ncbi:unnamed protein product [[Candida] boidinii]|nr:unnamed protein product [[Candida] boidinii]
MKNFNSFFTTGGFSFVIIGEKRFDNWVLNLIYLILGDSLIFLFQILMLCINLIDKLKFIKSTYVNDTDDDDEVNAESGNTGTTSNPPVVSDSTEGASLGTDSRGTNQSDNNDLDDDYELRDLGPASSTTAIDPDRSSKDIS